MLSPRGSARTYGGARVLGVGHRVVHGGARYAGPTVVTPEVLDESAGARSRSRRCISRTTSRRSRRCASGFPACRRSPASTRASIAASRPSRSCSAAQGDPRRRRAALRLPRPVVRIHRVGAARVAPEIAEGRVIVAHLGSGASLCALKRRQEHRQHARLHRARRPLHGHAAGCRSIPGVILYLFQNLGLSAGGRRDDSLQEVGAARHLRHQQRHARPARQHRAGAAARRRLLRLPRRQGDRRARRRAGRHRRRWCSPPASARTPPRSAAASARPRLARRSTSTRTRTTRTGPRISDAGSRVSAWVIPTNEELMIARHTGALLGISGRRA